MRVTFDFLVMPGGGLEPPTRGFSDLVTVSVFLGWQRVERLGCFETLPCALDRGGIPRGDRPEKSPFDGAIARSLNRSLKPKEVFKDPGNPNQIQADIDHGRRPAPGD
jgi:hypothetical protein